MRPPSYTLAFDEGAAGSADFAVSNDLTVTAARIGIFLKGDTSVAPVIDQVCPVVANVISLDLTDAQTLLLGAGRHSYILDIEATGIPGPVRLVVGPLVVSPGAALAFV